MRCLLISETASAAAGLQDRLAAGFNTLNVSIILGAARLKAALRRNPPDLIVMRWPVGWLADLEALQMCRAFRPRAPVLVVAPGGDAAGAVVAVRAGAADYVTERDLDNLAATAQLCLDGARRQRVAFEAQREAFAEQLRLLFDAIPVEQGCEAGVTASLAAAERRVERWVQEKGSAVSDREALAAMNAALVAEISERRRAEDALRQSEARYRQMFEKNRAIKLLLDPETGRIVQANPAACDFYGYSAEQLQQLNITDLSMDSEAEVFERMAEALHGQQSYFVTAQRLASGVVRDVEINTSPIELQDTRLLYNIVHDITERRLAERTLWHHTKRLQILHDIDQAILAVKSPEEIAQTALLHLRQVIPSQHANVMLFDFASQEAEFLAVDADGPTFARPGQRVPLESAWAPAEPWQNSVYVIKDLAHVDRPVETLTRLREEGVHAHLSVPLIVQRRLIGRLNLGSAQPAAFGLDHLDVARQVADSLAVAIQNGRLYAAEQHARLTAETLRSAQMALTQSLVQDDVYRNLLDHLAQLVPFDSACVMLLHGNDRVIIRQARGYGQRLDLAAGEESDFEVETTPSIRQVLETRQSLVIPDTAEFPGWLERVSSQHIRCWMGVPLVARDRLIGLCSIDKTEPGFFTERHVQLAEALAGQAAVAILNAQLFQEISLGHEQLQTLTRRLVQAQEGERRYVARELHDEAGQALTSLMVGLGLLERSAGCSERTTAQIEQLKQMVNSVSEDLHRLAVNLRPASLEHLGLVAALRQYIEGVRLHDQLLVEFDTYGLSSDRRLPQEHETALYRIVQEALTNVLRHAQANRAGVLIERRGDRVVAIIEDDGRGFDPEQVVGQGRLGLVGMRERAEMLDGTLILESGAGAGTTVYVEIPYLEAPDPGRDRETLITG